MMMMMMIMIIIISHRYFGLVAVHIHYLLSNIILITLVLFTALSLHQLSYHGACGSDERHTNMAMNGSSRPAPGES